MFSARKYSVLIPAHNEEGFIGDCLQSVESAADQVPEPVEIIVAINRCTDRTADIAARHQAVIVNEDSKNLARIITSCRKFDTFGDWYLFKNPGLVRKIIKGDNQEAADLFYYHTDR